jgi:hypothetical protein
MIVPRRARSALQEADQGRRDAQRQLEQTRAARQKLSLDLETTRTELTDTRMQLAELEQAEQDRADTICEAETRIMELEGDLEICRAQVDSLEDEVSEARQEAFASEEVAEEAQTFADQLEQKLGQVVEERDGLTQAREQLLDENAQLCGDLSEQRRLTTDLTRLLSVLEVGRAVQAPAPAARPGDKPITVKELKYWLGSPTVVAQRGPRLTLYWGKKHTARATEGVVDQIDGKEATRDLLAEIATIEPVATHAEWRIAEGESVRYVDLLAMFGRPQGTTGTGDEFSAWWSVGAWARTATAKVINGIVTEFDGRPIDPAVLCELVRHRAAAYRTPNHGLAAVARHVYEQAGEIVEKHLSREARLQARDGWRLKQWRLADFDSVGTWIAPTQSPAGAVTMRAAVVCTWVAGDGRLNTQRRFLVVTFGSASDGVVKEDFALFGPRN